jgi:uncharacterized protein involved in response to NO
MLLWIAALAWGVPVGGQTYAPIYWHAHEMLFGYAAAALAGFMLTAIPNWTGRMPLSGKPLLGLVALWAAGRLAMIAPDLAGPVITMAIDTAFLLVMAMVAAVEILAGRNWKNLKVLAGVGALALVNLAFHATVLSGNAPAPTLRAAVAIFIALVGVVGGRIIPSFTRNYLAKRGGERLPHAFGRFDIVCLVALIVALIAWILAPEQVASATPLSIAGILQAIRVARWQGFQIWREPLLLGLHLGYAFIAAGLLLAAGSALQIFPMASSIHVLTIGVVGVMTLSVMARAARGHTGRPTAASRVTGVSLLCLVVAALCRPLADLVPSAYLALLVLAGVLWIGAFSLFILEYAPILMGPSLKSKATAV